MPFVVKAASLSLLSHPRLNASVDEGREVMVYHGRHNIGETKHFPHTLT